MFDDVAAITGYGLITSEVSVLMVVLGSTDEGLVLDIVPCVMLLDTTKEVKEETPVEITGVVTVDTADVAKEELASVAVGTTGGLVA